MDVPSTPKSTVIRKPEIDKREYRHLVLPNRLQAVVVSDKTAHSGAAALCVGVGQLDDPPEVEGLAHFLEHMLFLGTEKYPDESNFDQFCASGGGYSNAWTSLDHTMYHFIVSEPMLRDTLDRFASFFSCPLFSESGTEREISAVNSENNKNLQDDDRREYQLIRSTCDTAHPMARFGAGNAQTLRHPRGGATDVREELLKLHRTLYSANLMKLAVVGNSTLDALEADVRAMFSNIPDRSAEETREWARASPFGASWRRAFLILPVSERRRVSLLFPFPPLAPEFRSKPSQVPCHLTTQRLYSSARSRAASRHADSPPPALSTGDLAPPGTRGAWQYPLCAEDARLGDRAHRRAEHLAPARVGVRRHYLPHRAGVAPVAGRRAGLDHALYPCTARRTRAPPAAPPRSTR